MKNTIKVIILLAIAALCGGCAPTLEEDSHKTGGTVTLTLNSPDTNGLMGEDGNVTWSQNDYVHINGKGYPVTLDAEDPTIAYVENVEESDCYYATHNSGHQLEEYCNWENGMDLLVPRVQNVGALNLPLIAYSETTDLHFQHTSGILRVGVTGNGNKIKKLFIVTKEGGDENISGVQRFSCENIKAGKLIPDETSDFDPFIALNVHEEVSIGSSPVYFNFIVKPGTYNFCIQIADSDNNLSVINTTQLITINQGTIQEMEPFEWTPVTPIEVKINNQDNIKDVVEFSAKGSEYMFFDYAVVSKSLWDAYLPHYENDSQLINVFLSYLDTSIGIIDQGIANELISYHINGNNQRLALDPNTDYKLIVSYRLEYGDTQKILDIKNAAVVDFRTIEAPCTITPEYQVEDPTTDGYRAFISIKTDSLTVSRAEITWGIKSKMESELVNSNLDNLISNYGYNIPLHSTYSETGAKLQFAPLEPDTEYIWIIRFVGTDGMKKIETRTLKTREAIMPDRYTWSVYSVGASLKNNLFSSWGIKEYFISDITIEKAAEADIFRIKNPFHGQPYLQELNFTEDDGDYYIYIDARNPDDVILPWKMNFTGIHFPETWLPESSMHIGSAITYSNQENKERAVWNKEQKYINFGTTLILANATGGYYSGATILYFNL